VAAECCWAVAAGERVVRREAICWLSCDGCAIALSVWWRASPGVSLSVPAKPAHGTIAPGRPQHTHSHAGTAEGGTKMLTGGGEGVQRSGCICRACMRLSPTARCC
jgi:hypothetical protein